MIVRFATVRSAMFFGVFFIGCAGQAPVLRETQPEASTHLSAAVPKVAVENLRDRLGAFAHDSMEGREAGTMGNYKATEFIAQELARIGLQPAGDNGTYFQEIPLRVREPFSTIEVDGATIPIGEDMVPLPPIQGLPLGASGSLDGHDVIFGGVADSPTEISAADGRGKVVFLIPPRGSTFTVPTSIVKFRNAAAIVLVYLDIAPAMLVDFLGEPTGMLDDGGPVGSGPPTMIVSDRVADMVFQEPLRESEPGVKGTPMTGEFGIRDVDVEAPARNVIAVLPGSDPVLGRQFVALGAHSDHVGLSNQAVDHDSLRAFLEIARPMGADSPDLPNGPTPQQTELITQRLAEIRSDNGAPRMDSIFNGADDDGSGSMGLLAIAEALKGASERPRRSVIFVWHTAEEMGLFGSQHFTENPTVPRDAIVAQLNMDMIGRGATDDVANLGGTEYLQLIGSRRLSTELGDLVEQVNSEEGHGFVFDYTMDADGHEQNLYCRSDHYMYARFNIPIVFLSTGSHRDYHQVTDEPQYIDFAKLARVSDFVKSLALRLANLDHAVYVDKPGPGPNAQCRQ